MVPPAQSPRHVILGALVLRIPRADIAAMASAPGAAPWARRDWATVVSPSCSATAASSQPVTATSSGTARRAARAARGLLVAHRGDGVGRLGGRRQGRRDPLGLRRVVARAHRDGHVAPGESGVLGRPAVAVQPLPRRRPGLCRPVGPHHRPPRSHARRRSPGSRTPRPNPTPPALQHPPRRKRPAVVDGEPPPPVSRVRRRPGRGSVGGPGLRRAGRPRPVGGRRSPGRGRR